MAGKTYPDSGKPYNPRLSATYYELRFSFLAKPLLEDLVADELEYRIYDSVTVEAIYETAFDEIFLIGYGEGDTPNLLLARLGSRVLKLQYIGESNLRPQLDLIAQRLADFTPVREG